MILIEQVFAFFSNYLIEFMGFLLLSALTFRWLAYRASKHDYVYFSSLTRELEINIDQDKESHKKIGIIDEYLSDILGRVSKKLPSRSLRFAKEEKEHHPEKATLGPKAEEEDKHKLVSLREYVEGKQGLIFSIQSESSVFNCSTPPNFSELTHRIMSQDKNWSKLLNHIPIEGISRMIDVLPGIFIVLGVFGTFIGISMALPEIANIDFNNLEGSGETLARFVVNVTFAMKTSIAGIFFSLILTILNTLFPIKDRRDHIFKKVKNSLQLLWYHVQEDYSFEMELHKVFPKLLEVLGNIDTYLNNKTNKKAEEAS